MAIGNSVVSTNMNGGAPGWILPSHSQQQQQPSQQPPIPGHQSSQPIVLTPIPALALANESTWLLMGAVAEQLSDLDRALAAYEHALRHNPMSISALTQVAGIARAKDDFVKAIEFFQRVLNISQDNGEIWGALGHCYLMMDDLQKAYTAYQQALYHLPNPKEPKLWYGIGILYDRYGSLEHAEEAFSSVLRMEQNFEKANEIYFRLGIIYKQQNKFSASLDCFRYILKSPPKPLTEIDIWFQLGHVHEQQKEYGLAKEAYERVLAENPDHSKVLQQLGWLYHQREASFANQELAISYLERSLNADRGDSQTWYLLGRVFMSEQRYNKAYEYYQQAVYRDGRSPTFWCSIGVLYYQINQFRDALDAYSRAIRLNPYISEVWFDLGSLYESCNNQIADAIDAYGRALDLDPTNETIKSRLSLLKNLQINGGPSPVPPPPQDVHPTAYNNAINQNSSEELRAGMGVIGGSGNGTSAPGGSRSGPIDLGPPPPSTLQSGPGRAESINDSQGHPTASGAPPSSSASAFNPYYPTGPPGHHYRGPPSPPPPQGPSAHYRGPAGLAEDSRSSRSVGSAMDVDRPPPPSSGGGGGRNLPNGRAPFDAARNSAAPSPHARHSDTYPASQAAYTNPYPPYIQPMTAGPMGVRHGYPTAGAADAGPSERALPSSTVEMEWERSREASAMHGGASGTTTGGGPGYYSGTGSHGGRRSPFDHRRRSDESTAASEDRGDRRGSGARSPFPSAYPPTAGYHHPPQQQQPPQHPFHSHPAGQERPRSPIIPLSSHDSQSAAAAAGSVVGASAGRRYDPTMNPSSNTVSNSPNSVPKHRRSSVGKGSSRMAAEEELLSTSPAGGPSSSSAAAAVKESGGGGGSRKRKNGTQVGLKGEEKKARRSRNSTTSGGNSKADRAEKAERERGEKADRTGGGDDEGGEKAEKPEKGGRHDRTEKVDKVEKNGSSKAEKNGKKGGDGPSLKVTLNANSGNNKSGKNSQSSTGRSASGPAPAAAALRYVDDNYDDEDEGSNSDAVGAADLLMGLAGGFSFSSNQSQPPPPPSQPAPLPLPSLSSPQTQPQVNGVSKPTVPSVPAPPLFPVPSVTSIHNLTSPSPSSIPVPSTTAPSTLTPKTLSSQTQPTTTKMTTVTTIHVPTTKPGFSEEALKNLRSSRPTTPMDVVPGSKDLKLGTGSTTSTPSKRSSSLVNSQTPVVAASATNAPIDETIATSPTETSPKIESTEDKGLPSTNAFNGGSGQDKVGANGATPSSPSISTPARSKEVDEPMRSTSTSSSPTRITSAPDSISGTIPAEPTLSIVKDVSMTSDHEKCPAVPASTSTPSSKPSSSSSNHLSRLLSPNPTPVSATTAPPSTPASALDGSSKAMPDRTAVSPQRSPLPSMTVNLDSTMNGGEVKSTDDRKPSPPKTLGAANASASSPSPSKEKISPVVDGDKISESEAIAEKADGNKTNTDADVEMEDVKA
ncbi:FOG: TPR repeat [Phaffia rhodozyma]|uniref:FOG: TPR repeat n=1 Tax=Phaffia rhodozyma TaxID=264483 RepID=A0A0F7SRB2_PHARH|nr:FOG: TPR repeat [Phaffia rhodozyma]